MQHFFLGRFRIQFRPFLESAFYAPPYHSFGFVIPEPGDAGMARVLFLTNAQKPA